MLLSMLAIKVHNIFKREREHYHTQLCFCLKLKHTLLYCKLFICTRKNKKAKGNLKFIAVNHMRQADSLHVSNGWWVVKTCTGLHSAISSAEGKNHIKVIIKSTVQSIHKPVTQLLTVKTYVLHIMYYTITCLAAQLLHLHETQEWDNRFLAGNSLILHNFQLCPLHTIFQSWFLSYYIMGPHTHMWLDVVQMDDICGIPVLSNAKKYLVHTHTKININSFLFKTAHSKR